ncbi:hypothetical protein [Mycolicibacterium peregrinum]|nr:hypothetical protein [Mycolicibacterium peregrinum]
MNSTDPTPAHAGPVAPCGVVRIDRILQLGEPALLLLALAAAFPASIHTW